MLTAGLLGKKQELESTHVQEAVPDGSLLLLKLPPIPPIFAGRVAAPPFPPNRFWNRFPKTPETPQKIRTMNHDLV